MKKYTVREIGNSSYASADTIKAARRIKKEARQVGLSRAVIVRNSDGQIVD